MTSDPTNLCDNEAVWVPQIASFWRRTGAAAVDALLLGAIGACLGLLWFDSLAALGRMGRFVGGAIALAYFGTLNSRIGEGQTLGKRLLKIRVTDAHGAVISLSRSACRATIFLLPFALNGTTVPTGEYEQLAGIALSILIVGVGVATAYLYCCNGRTRQSVHDLVVGTFVRDAESASEIHKQMWKPHLAIASGLGVVVLGVVGMPYTSDQPEFSQQLVGARRLLQSAVPDAHVSMWRGRTKMMTGVARQNSGRLMQVNVEMRVKPENFERLADDIAMAMFRSPDGVGDVEQVLIVVSYGYDIMIAHARTTKAFAHSSEEWLKRLKMVESRSAVSPV